MRRFAGVLLAVFVFLLAACANLTAAPAPVTVPAPAVGVGPAGIAAVVQPDGDHLPGLIEAGAGLVRMLVIFSPYELGPYSMGSVELRLSYEELADLVGPGGMARLGRSRSCPPGTAGHSRQ